ncbi:MAG: aminodeoxychorismate/anthranilate synthase component II [Phycisphaerales bacterium]|nr:aminodeoxychorismate/anthranilate synthase component II [Phycisphaerales bacterium]
MILLIDNYDSFTWNLVQRLGEIDRTLEPDRDLVVKRHDEITPEQASQLDNGRGPSHVIISPGPCTPKEAGVSSEIIEYFAGRVPVMGVCLGHQCMADSNGMTVARHQILMHGKTSEINHDGQGLFAGIEAPATVARYHSLIVEPSTIPALIEGEDGWQVSASCVDEIDGKPVEVVMGMRRVWADQSKAPLEGVQFHPESFMTPSGSIMLWNFLKMGEAGRDLPRPPMGTEMGTQMGEARI